MTLSNPFETLSSKVDYDEWGGQFSCSAYGCWGYATIAKYFPKQKVLAWECQDGHISKLENVDE